MRNRVWTLSLLILGACASTDSARLPAGEMAAGGGAPAAVNTPEALPCRKFNKKTDLIPNAPITARGKIRLNPIAAEMLKGARKEDAARLAEVRKVLYVLESPQPQYIAGFDKNSHACGVKTYTLSIDTPQMMEMARQAYQAQTDVTVKGKASWPETSVELVNNALILNATF